jgi:hypothetical protein
MPRALASHGWHFDETQRSVVLDSLRARRATVRERGCNYWVFEDPRNPGLVLEFLEGPDVPTVVLAREAAGLGATDEAIFIEVEL